MNEIALQFREVGKCEAIKPFMSTIVTSPYTVTRNAMKTLKHLLTWTAMVLLSLTACNKEADEPSIPSLDIAAATDNAKADDYFTDMQDQADAAADANGLRDAEDACAPTITIDTLAMPHTMTIDFGTSDCTAANGRMRRGVLAVTFTGSYREAGTVITVTPQGYYVNDNHVEGSRTITNMGLNEDHQPWFAVVDEATITAADGSWTATRHAERVRTWTAGSDTQTRQDDAYVVTGNGHGVNRNGVAYTSSIISPLHRHVGCPFITQGTVQVLRENMPTRTIDYGNGDCDNTYTVTVNGHTFTGTIG